MYSVIVIDEKDWLLMLCIIWVDNWSEGWVYKIKDELNGYEVYKWIGILIYLMVFLSKIVWIINE